MKILDPPLFESTAIGSYLVFLFLLTIDDAQFLLTYCRSAIDHWFRSYYSSGSSGHEILQMVTGLTAFTYEVLCFFRAFRIQMTT